MSKIIAICLFEIKRTFRKPSAYLLMLAMPLLFTLLFGGVLGSNSNETIPITIVDHDQSSISKTFVQQLKDKKILSVQTVSLKKAHQLLKDQDTEAIFTLNKGFEKGILKQQNDLISIKHQPNSSNSPLLKQLVEQTFNKMKIQVVSSQYWSKQSGEDWQVMYERLNQKEKGNKALTEIDNGTSTSKEILTGTSYSSAGFSIMFVMIMMLSVTGTIIDARKSGVWARLITSPISKFQVITGYFLSFFLIGWIQFMLLMVASSLFFDVQWGNTLAVVVLVSSLLLCVVGLGLTIAGLVKTTEQQNAIGTLIIVSTCMLGGVYWPLSIVPDFMQKIANFVPQSWAMKGFTQLIVGGGTIADILMPVFVLLGFSVLFLSIGISRVRYQ